MEIGAALFNDEDFGDSEITVDVDEHVLGEGGSKVGAEVHFAMLSRPILEEPAEEGKLGGFGGMNFRLSGLYLPFPFFPVALQPGGLEVVVDGFVVGSGVHQINYYAKTVLTLRL